MKIHSRYIKLMFSLFGAIALSLLLYFLLSRTDQIRAIFSTLGGILAPFLIGGVIAYILKPICNSLEGRLCTFFRRHGKPRDKLAAGLSILLALLLAVAVVTILLVAVLPTLIDSIVSVALGIPARVREIASWLMQYVGEYETISNYITSFTESFSTSIPAWINNNLLPNLEVMIGGVSSGVVSVVSLLKNVVMGAIASIYILGNRKKFAAQSKKILYCVFGEKWSGRILDEFRYVDQVFGGFIDGRLIDSTIIGILCFIGMSILKMPYSILISVLIGVTNIIPFFGPWIGAIPSVLLILLVDPIQALVFAVFVLILQQFDGNILGPKILSNSTGLSGFWVLFSIVLFGGLYGFVGMIIGVPLFAVIYDIIRKLVSTGVAWRQAREADTQTGESAPIPESTPAPEDPAAAAEPEGEKA